MRIIIISCMIVFLTILDASADDNNHEFRSFLSGTSCEQLVTGLKDKDTQKEFVLMVGAFITGANYAKSRDSEIDLKSMVRITDQFCQQNPTLPATTALVFLDKAIDHRVGLEKKQ